MEKEFQKFVRGVVPMSLWLDTKTHMHTVKHYKSGQRMIPRTINQIIPRVHIELEDN